TPDAANAANAAAGARVAPRARGAAGAEESHARRCGARPSETTTARATLLAEQLVQHGGEIRGLGVLDLVDERLPPGALLRRNVEQGEPALDLDERRRVVGERHDRVEAIERDHEEAAGALGRAPRVRAEQAQDLVGHLFG